MSRLIDIDDPRNCYIGMDGEYETYNIDPNVIAEASSVQPEPLWGKTVEDGRPLADREIVSRLRDIQKQVGGSYAIDRAIEVIEVRCVETR